MRIIYEDTGEIRETQELNGDIDHGLYLQYSQGIIIQEGAYENGMKQGKFTKYHKGKKK